MEYILGFSWNDQEQEKKNLHKWAYDEDAILMEQDEDLLFLDVSWTWHVLPFMFDNNCPKQYYIIHNFIYFIYNSFLRRNEHDIIGIGPIIEELRVRNNLDTAIEIIADAIVYYAEYLNIYQNPVPADYRRAEQIGRTILIGRIMNFPMSAPVLLANGNWQLNTESSYPSYLVVHSKTGSYEWGGYTAGVV